MFKKKRIKRKKLDDAEEEKRKRKETFIHCKLFVTYTWRSINKSKFH